jgi:hypothetical protein
MMNLMPLTSSKMMQRRNKLDRLNLTQLAPAK